MQRLRLSFTREEPLKYISHLDMLRLWVRMLRRARLPVALSEGFHPHSRLAVAAPLAVGVTSEAEILDLYLAQAMQPQEVLERLRPQMPAGMAIVAAEEVPISGPSAPSLLRSAEYTVAVETDWQPDEVSKAIDTLMAAGSLTRERVRDGKVRSYDLRPLIQGLWLIGCTAGRCRLGMRLRAEGGATGRPEEVARALGLDGVVGIHRTRLLLADIHPQ